MPRTGSPFLSRVRDAMRVRHYSIRTEDAYLGWMRRFILFHGKRHPQEMGAVEVAAFLTHLAVEGRVSAATQNQALNALVFLYARCWTNPWARLPASCAPSLSGNCQSYSARMKFAGCSGS